MGTITSDPVVRNNAGESIYSCLLSVEESYKAKSGQTMTSQMPITIEYSTFVLGKIGAQLKANDEVMVEGLIRLVGEQGNKIHIVECSSIVLFKD